MRVITLGDTHGRAAWKKVAQAEDFDRLVLLGDYFDSPNVDPRTQLENFLDIIAYKKAYPGKVTLLTGNHDFHYLPAATSVYESYSGFQPRYAGQISALLEEHKDLLQASFQWENYLFTHAGVTHTWLNNAGYSGEPVDSFINELFRTNPESFLFNGNDPYGDDVTQSPIWVRPASLARNAFRYETVKQVVGHTTHRKLEIVKGRFFFIDTLGTSQEYLVVEDGIARAEKVR